MNHSTSAVPRWLRTGAQLLMTLSLLLALLGPIAQSQAAPPAASNLAPEPIGGEPVPSLEPEPDELPVDDPYASDGAEELPPSEEAPSDEAVPSEEAPVYESSITISKWLCPSGYDYTDSESRPDADCTQPLDGIPFELSSTDYGPVTSTTGDSGSGVARFSGFPAGSYDLTEVSSPYETDGFRVCNDFGDGNPGVEPASVGRPFSFEVPTNQSFNGVCNWYNVPGGSSITISKWLCPAGYNDQARIADPQYDCTEALDGIEFTLYDQASSETTATTGDETSGQVVYDGLDPGDYQVAETGSSDPYDSYIIRCYTGNQEWLGDYESYGIDERYSYSFPDGQYIDIFCNWYNVPGGNSITIYKWLCPSGYDYTADGASPISDCTEALDDIEFTLSGPEDSDIATATTGDTDPGTVTFDGLDPGDYEVGETASPQSYVSSLVRCAGGNEYLFDYQSYATSDRLPFTVTEDGLYESSLYTGSSEVLTCDWYNIPGGNTITIYKWLCPYQYDYTDPESRPDEDCTEALDGVEFELTPVGLNTESVTATTGDPDPGIARFSDFGPGSHDLVETTTTYGTDGFRVCNDFGDGNPGAEPATVGQPFTFEVPADAPFDGVCNWYNVPDTVTTDDTDYGITISKWLCPAGYDYTDSDSSPEDDCTQALDGIDFSLTGPSAGQTVIATTGDVDPGIARFTDFGPGSYELAEVTGTYPTGGFRVCNDFGSGNPGAEPVIAGEPFSFEVPTDAPFNGVCDWYNVEPGNSVTVYKWLCPYGYDAEAYAANPQLDCTQGVDGIDFSLTPTQPSGEAITQTTGSDGPGRTTFTDLDEGSWSLTENGSPYQPGGFLRCYQADGERGEYLPIDAGDPYPFDVSADAPFHLVCDWYNLPYDNSITIYKWSCPYGYDPTLGLSDPYVDCTEVTNGVEFTVNNLERNETSATGNDGPGTVVFDGLSPATWTIEETPPTGYMAVLTGDCYERDGQPTGTYTYGEGDFTSEVDIPVGEETHWVCHWFNIYADDPGDVVIYKWTCPEGYDIYGYGANAAADCTQATNGVRFNAEGPEYTSQSNTGDAIDGAVMFGGLEPGDYTFTETLPADTLYVFTADCTGTSVDAVHPYPLYVGNPLAVKVNPGDRIVCNWYNVPKYRDGTIVLTKYICSTPTYTAAVNCEIYEGGQTFDLLQRQGGNVVDYASGSTGANGQLTWYGLDPGQYSVREEDGSYCRITASQIDDGYIGVTDATTTYVTVYNCKPTSSSSPGKPKPSNAPPGKFPNTGTDPNAAVGPATGPIAGTSSPSPDADADAADDDASGSPDASGCPVLSDPNETLSPSPSASGSASPSPSPSEQEVTAASLAPTPDADVESCDRGEVPASIVVEAVEMDLDIEVIETVDGVMQAPSGAEFAAWYRETSRLGEEGPIVIAGHLNYWNVPEGPFYGLARMAAGDIITVTGTDGGVYQYEVRSTEQFPSDASPNELFESVDESAGGETIVLITCGGEWDASISEYNERTVVVATRVAAGDEGS